MKRCLKNFGEIDPLVNLISPIYIKTADEQQWYLNTVSLYQDFKQKQHLCLHFVLYMHYSNCAPKTIKNLLINVGKNVPHAFLKVKEGGMSGCVTAFGV